VKTFSAILLASTVGFSVSAAQAASYEVRHAALHAYTICFIDTYARLHNQIGMDPAIDAADARCKPLIFAYRAVTDGIEAARLMIGLIQTAHGGGFDNLVAGK